MSQSTPYTPPAAAVADVAASGYGNINIFSTNGRLGRVRYFAYGLLIALGAMVLVGVMGGIGAALGENGGGIVILGGTALVYLAMLFVSVMLGIQRLHDLDKSGWLFLLFLIPLVNIILALYLLFGRGSEGENRFGNPPPPNSTGIVIVAWIAGILYVGSIIATIALPSYVAYQQQVQLMQQQ